MVPLENISEMMRALGYYPTNKEIKSWLKKERDNGISHLTLALSKDPNIKEAGILSFLLGIVHKKGDDLYITKGYINSSSNPRIVFHTSRDAIW